MTDQLTLVANYLTSILSGSPVHYSEKPINEICTTIKLISSIPVKSHLGNLLEQGHYQFDCWGNTLTKSKSMSNLIETNLDNNKVDFTLAWLTNKFILNDIDNGWCRVVLEFNIF